MAEALDGVALEALLRMVGDDPDFVGEVVDEYLADARRQLAAMRGAIADGASADLARAGHTLKGTSLNVGASALAELCRQIEHRAAAGDIASLAGLVSEAEEAFRAAAEALARARERGWLVR